MNWLLCALVEKPKEEKKKKEEKEKGGGEKEEENKNLDKVEEKVRTRRKEMRG